MNPTIPAAHHARQAAIVSPEDLARPVHVVGAGAVGSYTTLFLAKLGCTELHVYDHDEVTSENVGNQLYGPADVGHPKVEALAAHVEVLTGIRIRTYPRQVERESFDGIVILAVDTMVARRAIFERSILRRAAVRWLLDVRIGFLPDHTHTATGLLFTVRVLDAAACAEYRTSLYDDASTLPLGCGASGIVYGSVSAACAVTRRLTQIVRGNEVPLVERAI